jgi:hypothetical protein
MLLATQMGGRKGGERDAVCFVLGRGVEVKGNDGEIVTFFLSGKG